MLENDLRLSAYNLISNVTKSKTLRSETKILLLNTPLCSYSIEFSWNIIL